ncbi:MAG TPA: NAD(+)/NADH kinase, partial [Flavobacterium sp.]
MRAAIYGQYYQNNTEPIIRDIIVFFNKNNVDLIIEAEFLSILYAKKILKKEYKTFRTHADLDGYDILISIGGDGTILRAATLVRNTGIPILGINAGRLGFLATGRKDNIDEFLQFVIDKKYTVSERTLLSLQVTPEILELAKFDFALNEITVSRKDTASMI